MTHAMPAPRSWSNEYQPFISMQTGEDIPCYRIFPYDEPERYIAEANEHLPCDEQERHALLITAASGLYGALEYFFNIMHMHDYESSLEKGYVEAAMEQAREALMRAKGGTI